MKAASRIRKAWAAHRARVAGRPLWEREADNLRHVTSVAVFAIAIATVIGANEAVYQQNLAAERAAQEQQQQALEQAQVQSRQQQEDQVSAQQERWSDVVGLSVGKSDNLAAGARQTAGTFVVDGDVDFGSTAEFAQLTQAIGTFEDQGYSISVTLVDLQNGRSLRYRSDAYYYCASSIKAPFVIAGYQRMVESGAVDAASVDALVQKVLVDSDNDSYLQLRDVFGSSNFNAWLVEAGVEPGAYPTLSDLADVHYPHLSTNQEATMWTYMYSYLQGGSASAQTLVGYIRQRSVSPIKDALGATCDTWSKAGWIDITGEGGAEPATWDSGVVFAPSGTYVLCIASNAPSQLSALAKVVPSLDTAHTVLVGA
ncbi:MAG: hypothetical protein ACI4B6_08040 [Atopobiaceae bacterium]